MHLRSHLNSAHSNETQQIFYQILYGAWYFENEFYFKQVLTPKQEGLTVDEYIHQFRELQDICKPKVQHMIYLVMSKV